MTHEGDMWMGPRGGETWVPVEQVSGARSRGGWQADADFINGGHGLTQSVASHMQYVMSWARGDGDGLRPIMDMRAGVRGPGLIYFIDPLAARQNVLPESWSFPAQACYDAVPLFGDSRPEKVSTDANTLGYPPESAKYDLTSGTSRKLYIPIPPDHSLWVGVHGADVGDSNGVCVNGVNGSTLGSNSYPKILDVTDETRVNREFVSSSWTGVEVSLKRASGGASTVTLAGLIVQILPTGTAPETGGFISGQGHSGCKFDGFPQQTPYTAIGFKTQLALTASLVEVGDWL